MKKKSKEKKEEVDSRTKKAYERRKKGKRIRVPEGRSLIVAGRATTPWQDKPIQPFLNSGLVSLPPQFQLPTGYRLSRAGIPAEYGPPPGVPMDTSYIENQYKFWDELRAKNAQAAAEAEGKMEAKPTHAREYMNIEPTHQADYMTTEQIASRAAQAAQPAQASMSYPARAPSVARPLPASFQFQSFNPQQYPMPKPVVVPPVVDVNFGPFSVPIPSAPPAPAPPAAPAPAPPALPAPPAAPAPSSASTPMGNILESAAPSISIPIELNTPAQKRSFTGRIIHQLGEPYVRMGRETIPRKKPKTPLLLEGPAAPLLLEEPSEEPSEKTSEAEGKQEIMEAREDDDLYDSPVNLYKIYDLKEDEPEVQLGLGLALLKEAAAEAAQTLAKPKGKIGNIKVPSVAESARLQEARDQAARAAVQPQLIQPVQPQLIQTVQPQLVQPVQPQLQPQSPNVPIWVTNPNILTENFLIEVPGH